MVKKLVFGITLLVSMFFASSAMATVNFYGAAGLGYSTGSFRIGINNVEAGLLNSRTIGVTALSRVQNFYASVGMGTLLSNTSSYGFIGALGYSTGLLGDWLHFRAESNIAAGFNNYFSQELQMGLDLRF